MMIGKYVRTDGEIYETTGDFDVIDLGFEVERVGIMEMGRKRFLSKGSVRRSSDDLKDLVDEFVLVWNEGEDPYRKRIRFETFGSLVSYMRQLGGCGKHIYYDYRVYGAIWLPNGMSFATELTKEGFVLKEER